MKLFPFAVLALALAGANPGVADAQRYGGNAYQQPREDNGARDSFRDYRRNSADQRYDYSGRGYPETRDYPRGGYPTQARYAGYGYHQPAYTQPYYANNGYRARPCNDGSAGTIIGAIAGGLFGNVVAGRGNHTVGTVIGGAAGALAGRAIDKSNNPQFCR